MGRPSSFTQETADAICEVLAQGRPLREAVDGDGMPTETTVYRWLETNESFRDQYARARSCAMERMADEIVEIADDSTGDTYTDDDGVERTDHEVIARAKLRVDTRKWLMSKLAPKKYGDKTLLTGPDGESAPKVDINVRFG
jgi:hypothetical protein